MLQRIQTVYLLLFALCSILFCLYPVFKMQATDGIYTLSVIKTSFQTNVNPTVLNYNYPLIIISLLMVLINAIAIFRYDQRMMQLKLINIMFLLFLLLSGVILYDYKQLMNIAGTQSSSLNRIIIFMPIEIILLLLARNGIKKDEKLVRSSDRLR